MAPGHHGGKRAYDLISCQASCRAVRVTSSISPARADAVKAGRASAATVRLGLGGIENDGMLASRGHPQAAWEVGCDIFLTSKLRVMEHAPGDALELVGKGNRQHQTA